MLFAGSTGDKDRSISGAEIRIKLWRSHEVRGSILLGTLTWTLKLPDALKSRFKNEEITDILLVISYRGLLEHA